MPAGTVPVTFEPAGRTVWVARGETVLVAARKAGVAIPAPCGSRGTCGGCGIRVIQGTLAEPDPQERRTPKLAPPNVRLACLARVSEAVTIRPVVVMGLLPHDGQRAGDAARTTVAAVDLGTTTVSAVIIDANSGAEVGRATVANHQASWGSDVLSRVDAATAGAAVDLRAAAEGSILAALGAACDDAGRCVAGITRLVVAGNTVMSALVVGAAVGSLAGHPFDLPFAGSASLPEGSSVLSAIAPDAVTLVLPALGGFIGGDVGAGLVATGLDEVARSGMLLDLGTNAEVVAATATGLFGASAPAGPAFEGFGIRSGGPASPGAIERVAMSGDDVSVDVIGGVHAGWFCGSGLLSAIALLRRLGHVDADGLMTPTGPLERRFVRIDDVLAVDFSDPEPGLEGTGPRIALTQHDVRAFQLAKGAVLTAVRFVLRRTGVKTKKLGSVFVGGTFGNALPAQDLIELGVVPRGFEGRMRVVGNTSLTGAAMIAVNPELAARAEALPAELDHIELALDPEFTAAFMDALSLAPAD